MLTGLAIVNCSLLSVWNFSSMISKCFETFWNVLKVFEQISNNFWNTFSNIFPMTVQRHFQIKVKEMYKDSFKKTVQWNFQKQIQNVLNCFQAKSKLAEKFPKSKLAKLAWTCGINSPNESNSTNTYKHALTYLNSY